MPYSQPHFRWRHSPLFLALAGLTLMLAISVPQPTSAQIPRDDPVLGTWELDVERSNFGSRDKPVSQRRTYVRHPEGLEATVITQTSNGQEVVTRYVAEYDSAPSPLDGTGEVDSVLLSRIGPRTAIATLSHAGSEVGRAERSVSIDGNEMTVKVELKGNINSFAYYRRVVEEEPSPTADADAR